MRIFTIIFCLFLSVHAMGQTADTVGKPALAKRDSTETNIVINDAPPSQKIKPLYVVDGVIYKNDLKSINPKDIESVNILKGETAIAVYGTAGKNGVILITMKQRWRATHKHPAIKKPLIVLDGIIFKGDIKTIDPKTIASVSVLKGDKATLIWGHAGANGAVIITTIVAVRKFRPDTIR